MATQELMFEAIDDIGAASIAESGLAPPSSPQDTHIWFEDRITDRLPHDNGLHSMFIEELTTLEYERPSPPSNDFSLINLIDLRRSLP